MKSYTVTANGIRQFVVEEGEGAPVILLHGFPETHYAWRYQMPVLSRHYRVIAPDLRGYGETDKPASGYDKRNMARDIRELMRALGLEKVVLVGHDRGARVATRFAKDYPEQVDRLVVMDNVPTRIVARDLNASVARAYWFFLFHLVPDLPEALIAGREHIWLRHFSQTGRTIRRRLAVRPLIPTFARIRHRERYGVRWRTTAPMPKTWRRIWTMPM